MKYIYPVILEAEDDDENSINVTVPSIVGGVTCGDGEADAIFMAKDLIRLMLTEAPSQCSPPMSPDEARRLFPDKRIVCVEVEI